jgi:hypothetical protein
MIRCRRLAVALLVVAPSLVPLAGGFGRAAAVHRRADATDETSPAAGGAREVSIDAVAMLATLRGAPRADAGPRDRTAAPVTVVVPDPTGGSERFTVLHSEVMAPGLAAAHPEITTYVGRSLDHPGTTLAMDITPLGFHASVRGPDGQDAWYVDPAEVTRQATTYLSYFGRSVAHDPVTDFVEREAPDMHQMAARRGGARQEHARPGGLVRKRIYRLALTSDPSFAAYYGTTNVLAAKVTLVTRVDQIYNDDLAIGLQLIDATDSLNLDTVDKATGVNGPCGAHPCFDPADQNSDGQLAYCGVETLARNRTVLGQLVGASNYDIGHLALGVNGGGIAYVGVVGADYKAGGCTGLPQPRGDYFAIDYMTHEMGHQFSALHTFDGVDGACGGSSRSAPTSVEPGSGSSVMAYAGICGEDDLQPHTDPYFSQRTITQVSQYTARPLRQVVEVQTVSLRGFDAIGDTITLDYPGAAAPVTLTRGSTYNAPGLSAAIQSLTGTPVTIAQWGYDPFGGFHYPASIKAPDDSGFQVIFAASPRVDVKGNHPNMAPLVITTATPGVSGLVGETARGGRAGNRGHQVIATTNHAPRVTAPPNRTIPLRTPFTLRATGRDSDGDKLTYLWEQNDTGKNAKGTALVSETKLSGPLFRIFGDNAVVTHVAALKTPSRGENRATHNGRRTFPDMAQVLSGNTNARTGACPPLPPSGRVPARIRDCLSEFLPTKGYVGTAGSDRPRMHFRVTVRDGYPNGGGTAHDDVVLAIDQHAGPFLVTWRVKGHTLHGGLMQRVTWAVNGTHKLAPYVRLTLSTDGGRTWKHQLSRRTPNDGSARLRIPHVATRTARIRIQALGNYFFAVNPGTFRIRRH